MKALWKKVALLATILAGLVILRGAVTVGRALYFGGNWYAEVIADAWMYIGLASLAIAVVAWIMAWGRDAVDAPDAESEEMEEQKIP